jgi:hypothetical protein
VTSATVSPCRAIPPRPSAVVNRRNLTVSASSATGVPTSTARLSLEAHRTSVREVAGPTARKSV